VGYHRHKKVYNGRGNLVALSTDGHSRTEVKKHIDIIENNS